MLGPLARSVLFEDGMTVARVLGLLILTAPVACGTDVAEFPGSGGGGTGGTATGSGGNAGGGGNSGGGGGNVGGGDPCDCRVGAYVPVCGEDGMTYDAACGEQCVPVPIECDGACPCNAQACADLETQYAAALAEAKQCSPQLPVEQCLSTADDALACPCPTTVNKGPGTEKMDQLREQWNNLGCGDVIDCPEIACPEPAAGQCVPNPNGPNGVCSDLYTSP